jgi:hypothetical protein
MRSNRRLVQVLGVLAVVVVEVALFLAAGAAATRTSTNNLKLWTGTVSTPGASTVTVAFPVSVTSIDTGLSAQEFSASSGSSTAWGTDTGGGISNTSSATVTFPKLTPKGTGELYFGYDATANPASAGTTSGFHYAITSSDDIVAYDTNVSSAVQPTARQSGVLGTSGGVSGGLAVLITASGSSATSAPSVRAVGTLATKDANNTTTLAVSPRQRGDLFVLAVTVQGSTSITASSVSGGGVSTWTPVEGPHTSYAAQGPGTLSNVLFGVFLIVLLALIVLGVRALIRRRRSRATGGSTLPSPN